MATAPASQCSRLCCARDWLAVVAVLACLLWFWSRGERFIAANGPTFDEPVHLAAGYSYWATGSLRLNREDPPLLKWLWGAPLWFGERPAYPHDIATATSNDHWHISNALLVNHNNPRQLLAQSRRVNLALGCGLVLLAGWWAFRLWQSRLAGIGAVAFAVCDPTLLALSCILSTDIGLSLFSLAACYCAWEYSATPRRAWLFALGISLGLALGAKFSALAIVAGLGAAGALFVLRGGRLALPGAPAEQNRWRALLEFTFRVGLIAFLTLAATYGFVHFDQWGAGLKFQLTRASHGDGMMYLNGDYSPRGWFHYFLVLLPLKLPLGLLAGVLLVFATRRVTLAPRLAFVLVPAVVFFALASYSRVNLGVRVVLPVLPVFYLLASGLARGACRCELGAVLLAVCVAWAGVSASRSDPDSLTYFNEAVGGPRHAIRYVADSNVDWGQGLPQLKEYLDANGSEVIYLSFFGTDRPEAYGIRYQPLPTYGRVGEPGGEQVPATATRHVVVVSANNLLGIYLNDRDTFAWLRTREPIATLSGSLFVYDLTGDAEAIDRVRALPAK